MYLKPSLEPRLSVPDFVSQLWRKIAPKLRDKIRNGKPGFKAISNQSMSAFVQSYSQSQARLMFVATLGMDNFDCTKMNAHFKKFTACLREGLIHEWKQALLAPPLPLMSLNNSRFCSPHNSSAAFLSTAM